MRVTSLLYHDVVAGDLDASGFPGSSSAGYKFKTPEFTEHLDAIARAVGPDAVAWLGAPRWHEGSAHVLLTFDDGGISAYTVVAGLLEARGWRGHFLVTAGRIGTRAFLDGRHIRALHERGHVIGTHSLTHPERMSLCGRDELLREWSESIRILSDILGAQVQTASVPGGFYSRAVAETAAEAGVRTLFTSEPTTRCQRIEGCDVLGRYTLMRGTPARVAGRLAAGRAPARLRQWGVWNAKKLAKRAGGSYYLKLRRAVLKMTA